MPEVAFQERLKTHASRFPVICQELGISLSDNNAVCQRWRAAQTLTQTLDPSQPESQKQLRLASEFLILAPCLERLKDQVQVSDHIPRLIAASTYHQKLLELRTSNILSEVGIQNSLHEPPDVLATVDGEQIGLACKYLSSMKTLPERISEGRDQIEKARIPGIIVADITNIPEHPLAGIYQTTEEALAALELSTRKRSEESQRKIPWKLKDTSVGSVLFISDMFCIIPDHINRISTPLMATRMVLFSDIARRPAIKSLEAALMKLDWT